MRTGGSALSLKAKIRWLFSALLTGTLIASFQDCGRVSIIAATPSSSSTPVVSLSQLLVQTTLNHPGAKQLQAGTTSMTLSLAQNSIVTQQTLTNGQISINPTTQELTFTPKAGFRGTIDVTVYATY